MMFLYKKKLLSAINKFREKPYITKYTPWGWSPPNYCSPQQRRLAVWDKNKISFHLIFTVSPVIPISFVIKLNTKFQIKNKVCCLNQTNNFFLLSSVELELIYKKIELFNSA